MLKHLNRNKLNYFWALVFAGSMALGLPSMIRDWEDNGKLQQQYRQLKNQKLKASIEKDAIEDTKREAILDRLQRQTCRIALQEKDATRYAKPKADLRVDAMPDALVCFRTGEIALVKDSGYLLYLGNIGQKSMEAVSQNVYEGSILISGAN